EAGQLHALASAFHRQDVVVLQNFSVPSKNRAYLMVEKCNAQDDIRLVGIHLEDRDTTTIFMAETPQDEKRILGDLLHLLAPMRRLNLICYSGSLWQQQLLARRLAWHGLPTRITQRIKDIFFDVGDCIVFPTRRLGLREIAECCGFRWRNSPGSDQETGQLCVTSDKLTNSQKRALAKRSKENLLALRQVVVYLERALELW